MRIENKQSTSIYRAEVKQRFSSLDRNFHPKQTFEFFGVEVHPVAAAPTEGSGTLSIHNKLADFKMLTFLNEDYSVEDLYAFFFESRDYAVYTMDCTESSLHKWNTLKSKLPAGNIKYVFVKTKYANSQQFLDFCKKFKEDNPKVVLFGGILETVECAERAYHNGIDVIVVDDSNSSLTLQNLDELVDLARINDKFIATSNVYYNNPLAAGVDFCLCDSFVGFEESGGKVEVRDYGTVKVTNDEHYGSREHEFRGSVVGEVENIVENIRGMMHRVGAKDLNSLVQRTIFITN